MAHSEFYRPSFFEETAGTLYEIVEQDGILNARIGKVRLALPATLEENLLPLIGQRIAILRTDLPQREYLFRILTEEPNHVERDGMEVEAK